MKHTNTHQCKSTWDFAKDIAKASGANDKQLQCLDDLAKLNEENFSLINGCSVFTKVDSDGDVVIAFEEDSFIESGVFTLGKQLRVVIDLYGVVTIINTDNEYFHMQL